MAHMERGRIRHRALSLTFWVAANAHLKDLKPNEAKVPSHETAQWFWALLREDYHRKVDNLRVKIMNSSLYLCWCCSPLKLQLARVHHRSIGIQTPTKSPVCPVKAQISLGIHPVWSESLLSLIWVFTQSDRSLLIHPVWSESSLST